MEVFKPPLECMTWSKWPWDASGMLKCFHAEAMWRGVCTCYFVMCSHNMESRQHWGQFHPPVWLFRGFGKCPLQSSLLRLLNVGKISPMSAIKWFTKSPSLHNTVLTITLQSICKKTKEIIHYYISSPVKFQNQYLILILILLLITVITISVITI